MQQKNLTTFSPLEFRAFEAADAVRVSEIICSCLRDVNSKDYTPIQISQMLPGFAAENLVSRFSDVQPTLACRGGTIVGIGILVEAEIRTMFVDPTLHGQGIGAAIMDYLEQKALSQGRTAITMFSSITARGFYEKGGYTVVGETVHPVAGKMFKIEKQLRR